MFRRGIFRHHLKVLVQHNAELERLDLQLLTGIAVAESSSRMQNDVISTMLTGREHKRRTHMPPKYVWMFSEIPPKCKLQKWEKEQCVAEAEKFIAAFYRPTFIKPPPKDKRFNYIVDFRAAFGGSYLRFYAKYACPGPHALSPFFEYPFARLGCFGRDRWNLWARRHNDQWLCIEPRPHTLRECFEVMREDPWFQFL